MNKDELAAYLKGHTIFSELEPKQIKVLVRHVGEQTFAAGELLFAQADSAERFYIVRTGAVTVEVPSVYGPSLVIQQLGPDQVLGWSWLMPPYKWTFQAIAAQDTTLLVFDGKALLDHCEKYPSFGYALMKCFTGLMSERLQAARLKMMESWAPAGWA